MPESINILCELTSQLAHAKAVAEQCDLEVFEFTKQAEAMWLVMTERGLVLRDGRQPKLGDVTVDWVEGAVAHRRNFGGGRGQAIAKACGLKSGQTPSIIDATAGLGRDAMVLASLGCRVSLIERSPVVAALLFDGYRRALENEDIGDWVSARVALYHGHALDVLKRLECHDVVYLDPMYPHRQKSAQVKKEMRVFQGVVGSDADADALLDVALSKATKRVVVKRPDYAEPLAGKPPHHQIKTKKNRFDVYMLT
ncbi:class I SAM-dependent methyltransferase [Echinimonas agarilytica]|uniref:Ribosomal RNA small subunit methyltransferase J n=1 Tax=Echinimonas agarilytica TaxID=1215918 RepID=A0AA41WA36_9GAMM|nr:class I SAM-dependent methyltransferase [Echinimonas agarilytica]